MKDAYSRVKNTYRPLKQDEIDELQDQVDRVRQSIRADTNRVKVLLLYLTECDEDELEFVENYFIKRDVYKTLKATLKDPVVYTLESSTDEHGGN